MLSTVLIAASALLPALSSAQLTFDSGAVGGPLEIVDLYYDQWPTGITVSHSGCKFSNYPTGLDSNNTNTGNVTRYAVAELHPNNTEIPYPNAQINNPPGGAINYITNPPTSANYQNYLIGVQSVVLDPLDSLWILDTGRVQTADGALLNASPGGTKLICVNIVTNSVIRTIIFPSTVAFYDSCVNDVRFDLRASLTNSGKGVAYITDSLAEGRNGIIIVDLGTGKDLYFGPVGGRGPYPVPTKRLRDRSKNSESLAQGTVQNHSQRSLSDGFETDSNGLIYAGNMEHNLLLPFNPANGTVSTLVRDPRISWTDTMSVGSDGYLYFTDNQLAFSKSTFLGIEGRVGPFALLSVKLPNNGTRVSLQ